jgi:drug/metabolite transporter (DMT)-like permease
MFGLASAACWGAGDFSGGLATRRSNVYRVILASQIVGVALLIGLALAFAEQLPSFEHLLWGGAAGLAGTAGLIMLYRALATGRMGAAAPVSAVITAIVPVVFGMFVEGLPKMLQLVGFGLALIGVWFISRSDGDAIHREDLKLPMAAGVCFGVFFILINRVTESAVLWPLVAARLASIGLLFGFATMTRQPRLPGGQQMPLIALVGVLDAVGNAFFAIAGQVGRLDIAAVLSSLYPAMTVWLAWLILKERISRSQSVGIVATLAAIVLISV